MKKYKIIGRSLDVFAEQKRGMTIMKKYVLVLSLFLSFSAKAEIKTYECGEQCTATLDTESGIMRVEGNGEMRGYNAIERYHLPWTDDKRYIKKVVIDDGITNVGSYAFFACTYIKTIELSKSVQYVDCAFDEIAGIQSVTMYDTTVWLDQDNFNDSSNSPNIKINCYGDLERCKTNFLNTKNMKSATTFYYKGKKIYTIDEANKVAGKVNSVKIRYR